MKIKNIILYLFILIIIIFYNKSGYADYNSGTSVAFSEVTGSASASQLPLLSGLSGSTTASQLPLISGLLGSATSAQLPVVIRLTGTTTKQVAGAFGQLYLQSSIGGTTEFFANSNLILYFDGAGSSTTITNSASGTETATAYGNTAITTQTAVFGQSVYMDGAGDYIEVTKNNIFSFPGGTDFDIRFRVRYDASGDVAFIVNGDSVAYAYGWELWHQGGTTLKLMHQNNGTVFVTTSWTPVVGQWYAIRVCREGTTYNLFVNGSVLGSATTATSLNFDTEANLTIGRRFNGVGTPEGYFKGFLDSLWILKGSSGGLGTYTVTKGLYTQYSAKYADPVTGNIVLEILTSGTDTTRPNYMYCNATTTVFGLGTNTAVTATTTAYTGWFDGAVRATAFNVASTEKIKDNIQAIKIKPDLLDAEAEAKVKYIADNKSIWIASNQGNYETVITETGTGTITRIDTVAMEIGYVNYIELAWASDLNQDTLIENVQAEHQKDFWQKYNAMLPKSWNPKNKPDLIRRGFVAEEVPEEIKGDDKLSIDPMAVIAYTKIAVDTLKKDAIDAIQEIGSLTAALENLRVLNNLK